MQGSSLKFTPGQILVAMAAFLAPLIGGSTIVDTRPLAPGELGAALFGQPTATMLSTTLLVGLLAAAGVWIGFKNKVVVTPQPRILYGLAALSLFVLVATVASSHKFQSAMVAVQWLSMIGAVFVTVAALGKDAGPKLLYGALVAGCALVAANGIREYGLQSDPNWRIFSTWFHPNVLAGILSFGAILGVGLLPLADRVGKLLCGLAAVLCATGVFLSGSKGGLLTLGLGLVMLVVMQVATRGPKRASSVIAALAVLPLALGLTFALNGRMQEGQASAGPGLGRMSQAGSGEQSAGFRQLLWKTSLSLMKENPLGSGLGTFRYYSAKPGLVTSTQLAHSSFLQFGVEAGALALGVLALTLLLCAFEAFKAWRRLPEEVVRLRAAGIAALVAAAAHNCIDSDWSHMGAGLAFFLVLGAVLSLAADGVTPENTRPAARWSLVAGGVALTLLGAYFANNEIKLSVVEHGFATRDRSEIEGLESQKAIAYGDSRVWFAAAKAASMEGKGPEAQIAYLERASACGPSAMLYRSLARSRSSIGENDHAVADLQKALVLDPNNLPALNQWLAIEIDRDTKAAVEVAHRIVAVEDTTYFKTRALPEIVPTGTVEARLYLAKAQPESALENLGAALKTYQAYARTTIPHVLRFAKGGLDGGFGGESLGEARKHMALAREALQSYGSLAGSDSSLSSSVSADLDEADRLLSEFR